MAKSELEEYKEYVAAQLNKLSPLLQSYALGDFSGSIEIPEEEDEFTELLVGLTLMVDNIKELIKEKEGTITKLERAEEEIRRRTEDLALINALNNALNRGDSLQQVTNLLAQETKRIFSGNAATIYLLSEDREHLVMQNLTLPPAMADRIEKLIGMSIPPIRIPLKAGSPYLELLQAGKPRIIDDPATIQRLAAEFTETIHLSGPARQALQKLIPQIYRLLGIQSLISVPLVSESEAIGLLDVSRHEPFTEADLHRFVTISGQLTAIIERKRAEEALRESEEKYRNLFENAEVGMYRTKLDGTAVLAVNQKISEIIGMPKEEVLLNPAFIHWENPADREEMVRRLTQEGSLLDYEIRIVAKNGEVRTCLLSGKVFREEGAFEGSLVDITERKRAEEALAQRVQELERFHRLTVGRELRMIELKRQINELSEQLGKEPPYDFSLLE